MYAGNEPVMKINDVVLNDVLGELYTIKEVDEKNCRESKYPLTIIQAAQNQKQTNIRGLEKSLKLKIGAKVILTVNLDIQDRIIIGQTETISHIEFVQSSV